MVNKRSELSGDMLTQSYLSLQEGHLKPLEKWGCEGDELYLVFPNAGACQITSFSSNVRVATGDMIAMTGRSGAKLSMPAESGESGLAFSWFSLSLDCLFPMFAAGEISFLQNIQQEYRNPKIYSKTTPLVAQCRQLLSELGPKIDLNHRSQLLRVAALMLSLELKSMQQKQVGFESAEDHMLRVFEQLSSHQLLNLSVEELSQKFGCSRRHLSRLFHQRFGLSVAALRMEMRLLKASTLLRDPSVKVINVAEQCGFNHLGLFNTCFKRRFGVTPGVWRNMQNDKIQNGKPRRVLDTCPLQVSGLCPLHDKHQTNMDQAAALTQPQNQGLIGAAAANAEGKKTKPVASAKAGETRTQPFPAVSPSRPIGGQPFMGIQ
jgi:AraC-like DNA-binding protein